MADPDFPDTHEAPLFNEAVQLLGPESEVSEPVPSSKSHI